MLFVRLGGLLPLIYKQNKTVKTFGNQSYALFHEKVCVFLYMVFCSENLSKANLMEKILLAAEKDWQVQFWDQ